MVRTDFVGVDVSKHQFNIALRIRDKFKESLFENNSSGHKKFVLWLKKNTNEPFVCLEATGPYSETLAEYLVKHEVRVSIVNPMQIKHYAKSILSRNKNDNVDAKIIASYAEKCSPRLFVPRSQKQKVARETVQFIDTLTAQKRQLENQLESVHSSEIRKEIQQMIKVIEKRILKMENNLSQHVEEDTALRAKQQCLLSIIGIGEKTANRILSYLPDIDRFSHAKQLAAFIGITPKQHQSGKHQGQTRLSKYGDPYLRKTLYMPAIVVKNHNPYLKKFCQRLEKNGLKPKQIVCAVIRKLIHIIFGMLKHKQKFNPSLV